MRNSETICGCFPGTHTGACRRRGRDKMTQEEYDADVLKEKVEKQAEALAELREEAAEEIEKLQAKAEQYGVIGKLGIDAFKTLRPMLRELSVLAAEELRSFVTEDLVPLGQMFDDAGAFLVRRGAEQRAKLVNDLMSMNSKLSEATCLAIVLASSEAVTAAVKNSFDSNKKDSSKK